MFMLLTREGRQIFRMKNGKSFLYSSKDLANRGKIILENHHKTSLVVVPA